MKRTPEGTIKEEKIFYIGKKKYLSGDLIFNTVNYLIFGFFTLICLYPFYYLFINTISSNELSANGLINFIPRQIHFKNYIEVFKLSGVGTAALVSVARTVIGTICTVFASAFLGFMFTQKRCDTESYATD